jgi:hypothetical protein
MSISYHVYKNDGAGGPIDYTTVVATTAGLSYVTAALAMGSSNTFGVRAFDTVTGYEELNTDARVTINVSATGADVTNVPPAPAALTAFAGPGGTATVRWKASVMTLPAGKRPTGFHVYMGTPAVSYASPVATVAYVANLAVYSANLSGLADEAVYQIAVRAYNATGEEQNTGIVSVEGEVNGPGPVEDLAGSVG